MSHVTDVVVSPCLLLLAALMLLNVSTNNAVVAFAVVSTKTAPATMAAYYWTSSSSSTLTSLKAGVNEKDNDAGDDNEIMAKLKSMTSNLDVSAITKRVPTDFDISSLTKSLDMSSLTENFSAIVKNLSSGELGQRGEAYVAVQAALLLCIAIGGIPVVGDAFAMFFLGPGLLLVGIATMAVSLPALGPNLSPWPVPSTNDDSYLVTDEGLYAQLRHPLYAGLLATCAGLSIVTGSTTRLVLTLVLGYVLEIKSNYEEEELELKFPEYEQYKKNVPTKFFPKSILQAMPWST
jgi:protein-S-isoprenylcysteine O-methyltransferase Ste14